LQQALKPLRYLFLLFLQAKKAKILLDISQVFGGGGSWKVKMF